MSIPTITPEDLYHRMERHEPVKLIDVRAPGEFSAEYVEQSELMPLGELDAGQLKADNGAPVYIFCRTGNRSSEASATLTAAGLEEVYVVAGGLEAWKQAGLPVKRGKGVISLERQVRIGAGGLVLLGVLLGWLAHPAFYVVSAFVGAGLIFAGVTDWCGMAKALAKMPWNRRPVKP